MLPFERITFEVDNFFILIDRYSNIHFLLGRYVSIEDVREVDEEIIWTMAVASSAGGRVPKAITELVMCKCTFFFFLLLDSLTTTFSRFENC